MNTFRFADIHAIVQIDGIATYTPLDETRSIVALRDGHRLRAAATRVHNKHRTEDKDQAR